jgi:hypothetical protein
MTDIARIKELESQVYHAWEAQGVAMARVRYLEDLLGRYADEVGAANGIYFELVGPEGDYIVELGERVASAREAEPKPKHTGQYSVPQSRD